MIERHEINGLRRRQRGQSCRFEPNSTAIWNKAALPRISFD